LNPNNEHKIHKCSEFIKSGHITDRFKFSFKINYFNFLELLPETIFLPIFSSISFLAFPAIVPP
jgi:hypothetical protein